MPILMFDKDENFSVLRLEDVSYYLFVLACPSTFGVSGEFKRGFLTFF